VILKKFLLHRYRTQQRDNEKSKEKFVSTLKLADYFFGKKHGREKLLSIRPKDIIALSQGRFLLASVFLHLD